MKRQSAGLSQDEIMHIIKELSQLEASLKWATNPRILLEVSLLKVCKSAPLAESDNILERLAALEEKIRSGNITVSKAGSEQKEIARVPEATAVNKDVKASRPVDSGTGRPPASVNIGKELPAWEKVLEDLKKSGRMVLYTNLLGSKAVELDSKFIGVIFSKGNSFKKMLVSKAENLEVLEAALVKNLEREVKVRCLDEDDARVAESTVQAEEKDEFVEKAQEIAKRVNAPLNIIDE